jgi:hypothetical protein
MIFRCAGHKASRSRPSALPWGSSSTMCTKVTMRRRIFSLGVNQLCSTVVRGRGCRGAENWRYANHETALMFPIVQRSDRRVRSINASVVMLSWVKQDDIRRCEAHTVRHSRAAHSRPSCGKVKERCHMASRLRVCLASVLPFFLGGHNLSAQLDDVWLGTWKVNLAKSTYSPGVLRRAPLWPSGSASAVVSSRPRVVGWMSRAPVRWVVVTRLDGKRRSDLRRSGRYNSGVQTSRCPLL